MSVGGSTIGEAMQRAESSFETSHPSNTALKLWPLARTAAPNLFGHNPASPFPFLSGVGHGGEAVEMSVTLSATGLDAIRFIVQPGPQSAASNSKLTTEFATILDALNLRKGGHPLLDALSTIVGATPNPNASFTAWLGVERQNSGNSAKIYVNPYASSELSGAQVAGIFFGASQNHTQTHLEEVTRILRGLYLPQFTILGANVRADGQVEFKSYYVVDGTNAVNRNFLKELNVRSIALSMLNDICEESGTAMLETHLCFDHQSQLIDFKINVAVSALGNEYQIRSYVERYCNLLNSDIGHLLQFFKRLCEGGVKKYRLNFLGFGRNKLDVYFSPW